MFWPLEAPVRAQHSENPNCANDNEQGAVHPKRRTTLSLPSSFSTFQKKDSLCPFTRTSSFGQVLCAVPAGPEARSCHLGFLRVIFRQCLPFFELQRGSNSNARTSAPGMVTTAH